MLLSGAIAEQELISGRKAILALIEASDIVVAAAELYIVGFLAATESSDTVIATNLPLINGSLDAAEDDDALAGTGQPLPPILGNFDRIEANDILVAVGLNLVSITGILSIIEISDTVVANGVGPRYGTLSIVEAGDTLVSSGISLINSGSILREDGTNLLREDSNRILQENAFSIICGHAQAAFGSGTTLSIDLTTSEPGLIVIIANAGNQTANSVTASGLTFTQLASPLASAFGGYQCGCCVWTAYSASPLTAETISASFTTNNGGSINAFCVSNVNSISPLDSDANSIKTATGTGTVPTITGLSSSVGKFVVFCLGTTVTTIPSDPTGFTVIDSNGGGGNGLIAYDAYMDFALLLSSETIAMGGSVQSGRPWAAVGFVVEGDIA